MIDLTTESLISLREAGRRMPGGSVKYGTVWLWAAKGVDGIKLETVRRGRGRLFTTMPAVHRFIAAVTAAKQDQTTTPERRNHADARRELAARHGI